ncbi:MAG: hypothetical protein Fur0037_09320 [Planctomycetota bacterium]
MGPIGILHEDEHLIVVDKPPGVLTVPAPGRTGSSLVDVLRRQLGREIHAVHRLDEDTSGAMILAGSIPARQALEGLFRSHAVERLYLALLTAVPSPPSGRIEARLQESGGIVRVVKRGGKVAVTNYRVLERRGTACLVECRLETGRRNQIRVHLAELGCPLAGDRKYGYRRRAGEDYRRVMLHSWRLSLVHPISGERLSFEAEAPEVELRPGAGES